MSYVLPLQIRWSDLDANAHVRHSAYYDWGAFCRIQFLSEHGLDIATMHQLNIGPIIFREEATFRREIRLEDTISISLQLFKARKDFSRWTIHHQIFKADVLAATIVLDGAWMNTELRKLCTPPVQVLEAYDKMPKSEGFEWS